MTFRKPENTASVSFETTPSEPTSADAAQEIPDDLTEDASDAATEAQPETPAAPLLELRDGLPALIDTQPELEAACTALAAGTGPVAIDAERASGYRYSGRAYLIQLRREGAGTMLVDPIAFDSLAPLADALDGTEWILHAATQDLPCLTELDLHPAELFDTELAGRLLGYPRVGLATLVETRLGFGMKKEHSAADWSTRPMPDSWLEYAALDVEVLVELRDDMAVALAEAGKAEWAREEFAALRSFAPTPRVEPWRRTSGLHRVRGRRLLGAVRELWEARDTLARERDISPGRIIGDNAIVAAAMAMPTTRNALLSTKGFHGRGAQRYADRWMNALDAARELPEKDLPGRAPRVDGPPPPRAWAEKSPAAAQRLTLAREDLATLCEEREIPAENVLSPDSLRRILWDPPAADADTVGARLREYGARQWQIDLVTPLIVAAIAAAQPPD